MRPQELHLWYAKLDRPESEIDVLQRMLAADEHARLRRMKIAAARARFIVARGILRKLLGAYLGTTSDGVTFDYGPEGKPSLRVPRGSHLHFNVSHTRDHALFAVTRTDPVGVDIERIRPIRRAERLAARVLTPSEHRSLAALPEDDWTAAFLTQWTRKEACAKALGVGVFRLGLNRLDLAGAMNETGWALLRVARGSSATLSVRTVVPPVRGCVAAVAVVGPPRPAACFTWHPERDRLAR